MRDEWHLWLQYAEENHQVAVLCFESNLFNSCLQNTQQAVEKLLKALCSARGLHLKRTHSIRELIADLRGTGIELSFAENDVDLLDSIYLPSKYPLGSALPAFYPDKELAQRCLTLTQHAPQDIRKRLPDS